MHKNLKKVQVLMLKAGYFKCLTDLLPFLHHLSESAPALTPSNHILVSLFTILVWNIKISNCSQITVRGKRQRRRDVPTVLPCCICRELLQTAILRLGNKLQIFATDLEKEGRFLLWDSHTLPVGMGKPSPSHQSPGAAFLLPTASSAHFVSLVLSYFSNMSFKNVVGGTFSQRWAQFT